MDLRSTKDDVVGRWVVQHKEGPVKGYLTGVDWKSDVHHGELLLPTESDEDGRPVVDV